MLGPSVCELPDFDGICLDELADLDNGLPSGISFSGRSRSAWQDSLRHLNDSVNSLHLREPRLRGCETIQIRSERPTYDSPGQRPGYAGRRQRGALKGRNKSLLVYGLCRPFRALYSLLPRSPGRCPGLSCYGLSGRPADSFTASEVSDGSQPLLTFDLCRSESVGSRSPDRLVH
jgi:hypothetical protein